MFLLAKSYKYGSVGNSLLDEGDFVILCLNILNGEVVACEV